MQQSEAEGQSGNNTRSGARSGWLPILVQSLMSLNLCAPQFSLSKAESMGLQAFYISPHAGILSFTLN